MDIVIKKLTSELISDYIDFFDNRAFSDNPEWSACYCVFFHWNDEYKESIQQPHVDIHEHNRNLASRFIKEGILHGYLAYAEGVAMGWCNANDKSAYETLNRDNRPDLWDDDSRKIKCVTCFTIAPEMRRKGLSKALLKRVCDDAVVEGYEIVEAYPRKSLPEMNKNYHGPFKLYEKAGFTLYKELEKESIVRKYLRDG
jgi:GNAT superfamily N-acetyltransferase